MESDDQEMKNLIRDGFVSGVLVGGFGNQMFIIFTSLSYAIDNNLKHTVILNEERRKSYFDTLLYQNLNRLSIRSPIFNEKSHGYEKIRDKMKNFCLRGYFQSWKYFHHNKEKILDYMGLKQIIQDTLDKHDHYLENTATLHFRLGDYKNLTQYHALLDISYYKNAMKKIDKNSKVLYFFEEEDREEVSNKIKILQEENPEMVFTPIDTGIVDWEQVLIMSGIKDNIIANSTFSWWGAYLSDIPDKKIVYPSTWFGPRLSHLKIDDLFFDHWIKI